jgi:hypothetical protein
VAAERLHTCAYMHLSLYCHGYYPLVHIPLSYTGLSALVASVMPVHVNGVYKIDDLYLFLLFPLLCNGTLIPKP